MPGLSDLITGGRPIASHRQWPRVAVDAATRQAATAEPAQGGFTLLALWGEPASVHMALRDEATEAIVVLSRDCADGRYPSVGARHPPATRLERAAQEPFGLTPIGLPDTRPWLDHGRWSLSRPLGAARVSCDPAYALLAAEGESLHQIPVGHADIIEPGHFRFSAGGEMSVCTAQRDAYVHKGIEGLMAGATLEQGARLAGRISGDSTVAYALIADVTLDSVASLRRLIASVCQRFPALIELCENTASLQDRTAGTGVLAPDLARQFGAGGFVGRVSGRRFDARRSMRNRPHDGSAFEVPTWEAGDVKARVSVRIREVGQGLFLIDMILGALPAGALRLEVPAAGGEGLALVEGFRGDILV